MQYKIIGMGEYTNWHIGDVYETRDAAIAARNEAQEEHDRALEDAVAFGFDRPSRFVFAIIAF